MVLYGRLEVTFGGVYGGYRVNVGGYMAKDRGYTRWLEDEG